MAALPGPRPGMLERAAVSAATGNATTISRSTQNARSAAAPRTMEIRFVMGSDSLLFAQLGRDQGMHEFLHVTSENRDLAHQGRRDEGELFLRREKHRLEFAMQVPAHVRELELEFEVGHRAQPAYDYLHILLARDVDRDA